MIYDDHGGNQALDVAEAVVRAGGTVEVVTPERGIAPDVGGLVAAGYLASLARAGVRFTVLRRLRAVRRTPDGLVVTFGVDETDYAEEQVYDAVVAEMGTRPVTEVYDALVAGSRNGGEIDLEDLMALRPQAVVRNPDGGYQLFRIGDAVAGRNVHAAMLDAARLCRAI
jgi:pyruvate/2-oxoglutarate dehydrogenase complex dihydrolipoamide dehydrogenase (E3) component